MDGKRRRRRFLAGPVFDEKVLLVLCGGKKTGGEGGI